MNDILRNSERLKFQFGSKIVFSDGEEGVLTHLLFDPETRNMTYIGVKQGRLFGKSFYLPFDCLDSANEASIVLNVKRSDATTHDQMPQGTVLTTKCVVENGETAAKGTLLLMAVQPTSGGLAYIVARELRPGQDTMLQESYVTKLANDNILIAIDKETLRSLPPFKSDVELQREVESALFDFTPLHIDLKAINAHVSDSILYLDGNISSALRSDIMLDRVSGVTGLVEIKNRVVADDALAAGLALALGQDSRTRDLPIGVYPRLGVVRLSGAVHNSQQKAAASEIAQGYAGVRSVVNDLVVDPHANLLNVMSAPEGGETRDVVPGKYVRHTQ